MMNRRDALKHTSLLLGYSLSGSTLASILHSCTAEAGLDWKPEFFTEEQAKTISAMTECILPETDTPGAKALQVDRFVDKMLNRVLSQKEQSHFMKGMESFEQDCQQSYGKDFTALTEAEQAAILTQYDAEAAPLTASIWGFSVVPIEEPAPFFRVLKNFTLLGYFSAEEIARHVLSYDPVPGGYLPCIPLSEVGNAWSE